MTAINAFLQARSVHLFSDAAYVAQQGLLKGKLAGVTSKINLLPQFNAAFVISSTGTHSLEVLATIGSIPRLSSPNDIAAQFPELVEVSATGPYRAVLAYISDTGEPRILHMHRSPAGEATSSHASHVIAPDPGEHGKGWSLDTSDMAESGADLMERQRRVVDENGDHVIGGFCEHAVVTGRSISVSVVRRWHFDLIVGKAIDPVRSHA